MSESSLSRILWLDLPVNKPLYNYNEFVDTAKKLGITLAPFDIELPIKEKNLIALIKKADGYILSNLSVVQSFISLLINEIENGKKMLVYQAEASWKIWKKMIKKYNV